MHQVDEQNRQEEQEGEGESEAADERQPSAQQAERSAGENRSAEREAGESRAEELTRLDEKMSTQAVEQWLRKIPDDPGGLLRRKVLYQYRKRGGVDTEERPW